jgi:hypothetical protein
LKNSDELKKNNEIKAKIKFGRINEDAKIG